MVPVHGNQVVESGYCPEPSVLVGLIEEGHRRFSAEAGEFSVGHAVGPDVIGKDVAPGGSDRLSGHRKATSSTNQSTN